MRRNTHRSIVRETIQYSKKRFVTCSKNESKARKPTELFAAMLLILMFLTTLAVTANSATYTVSNLNSSGAGSLRQAILDANATPEDDDIIFGVTGPINLGGSQLTIADNGKLTINGPGAGQLSISGGNASRVFFVEVGADAVIDRVKIVQGSVSTGGGGAIRNEGSLTLSNVFVSDSNSNSGGGIINVGVLDIEDSTVSNNTSSSGGGGIGNAVGTLTISDSTISGNTALSAVACGGGIGTLAGTVTITNSTIEDNTSENCGGGIYTTTNLGVDPLVTITNSTISDNTAVQRGGGIFTSQDSTNPPLTTLDLTNVTITLNSPDGVTTELSNVELGNSIVADNGLIGTEVNDVAISFGGNFVSHGHNLIGNGDPLTDPPAPGDQIGTATSPIDPVLGPLQNNGGPTETHALLGGSPAINAGDNALAAGLIFDQRGTGFPRIINLTVDIGAFETNNTRLDFDGDLKTDISIFRPGPGEWWYLRSSDGGNGAFQFGVGTDIVTPADFTGDGKADIAFFRPSNAFWFVLRSEDNSFFSFPFGSTGDIPATGDYDGDGIADPAVFRPSNATWFILNSSGGTTIQLFGANGDSPVVQDYDGDGKDDIAIFRPSVSEWFIQRSSDQQVIGFSFGGTGDKAVPADYTGDGKSDVAFWRPSSGVWFVLRSEDSSYFAFPFGANGDIPVPGDYDGDGTVDPAVFRPANNIWFKSQSTSGFEAVAFGANGDVPLPSVHVAP